jgi:hypothetical protein
MPLLQLLNQPGVVLLLLLHLYQASFKGMGVFGLLVPGVDGVLGVRGF